jgi:prepilin-type N-terminal cleavage/methylation domain-containing protein
MVKKSMSGQRGFTLLEVMIAVFLLAVAIMGTASVTTSVIKGNSFSQTLTMATTLAKDKMEEQKAANFTAVPTSGSPDYATADGTVQASASGSYYTRTWGVTGTDPKTITVTVTWSFNRTVQLQTIRAK